MQALYGDSMSWAADEVNNHVHTTYSFSPYTPARAAAAAQRAGLRVVGIMDHDSVAGAGEMLEACAGLGIASTVGVELRVRFDGTALAGRKINNPDSTNIGYIALHSIPHQHLAAVTDFLQPINLARGRRNVQMIERLNTFITRYGLPPLDYQNDVVSKSMAHRGGSVTERHLLSALAARIEEKTGRGEALVAFLREAFAAEISPRLREYLSDADNPHYHYDLLGVLKFSILEKVFIQPGPDECPSVFEIIALANAIHAIPAYAYLGDVADSPTGDKKAERFEDEYLDELVPRLKEIGFKGVTYMPPRNSLSQLQRIQRLCREYDLMEISGVDINSSRQSFNCPLLRQPEFTHLITATWALVAHEKLASYADESYALFHPGNPLADLPLSERLQRYAEIGRSLDHTRPQESVRDWFAHETQHPTAQKKR